MTEAELQSAVASYLRSQYPAAIFHSDFGSGARLTPRQAMLQKRQNGGRRAWPDIFIAEPRHGAHGLFVELKKEGARVWKKNGAPASPHIAEQASELEELSKRGYVAVFAVGFDEAKSVIDEYLGGD